MLFHVWRTITCQTIKLYEFVLELSRSELTPKVQGILKRYGTEVVLWSVSEELKPQRVYSESILELGRVRLF